MSSPDEEMGRLVEDLARHWHHVIRSAAQNIASGTIIGRPLVAGALSQNVAKPQKDEDGQSQKNDGVNVHVAFTF